MSSKMSGQAASRVRAAVFRAISRAKLLVPLENISFSGPNASPESPLAETRSRAQECDLFILILWAESAYHDDRTSQTAIGHEISAALGCDRPVLGYVEQSLWSTLDARLEAVDRNEAERPFWESLRLSALQLMDYHLGLSLGTFNLDEVLCDEGTFASTVEADIVRWATGGSKGDRTPSAITAARRSLSEGRWTGNPAQMERSLLSLLHLLQQRSSRPRVLTEQFSPLSFLLELGSLYLDVGRIYDARNALREAKPHLGSDIDRVRWLALMGACCLCAGEFAEGECLTRQSLLEAQRFIDRAEAATASARRCATCFPLLPRHALLPALLNLALLAFYAEDYQMATQYLDEAESMQRLYLVGYWSHRVMACRAILLVARLWQTASTDELLPQIESLAGRIAATQHGDLQTAALQHVIEGEVLLFQRQYQRARGELEAGRRLARQIGDSDLEAYIRWKVGVLLGLESDRFRTYWSFNRAIRSYRRRGHLAMVPRVRAEWAEIRRRREWPAWMQP